jgi:hypothetical protein
MKCRVTWLLAGVLALAGLGLCVNVWMSAMGRTSPQPQTEQVSGQEHAAPQVIANPQQINKARTEPATPRPAFSETVAALVDNLRENYRSGTLPVRIRLQDQLDRYWEENPPAPGELLGLVGDASLPVELRTYFARTFANRVKMWAYSEEENEAALAQLRAIVASGSEEAKFRADLANVLTTVDPSDAAVQAITPLLSAADTQAVVSAVSALTKTTNPLAIEAAYQFVQNDEELLKTNPRALLAALGPLSTTDHDVTPMLNHVIQQTDDFKSYAGAVQCLIHAKSSLAVLESITTAYAAAHRFPQQAAQADHLCRAAAGKHAQYFEEKRDAVNAASAAVIQRLLQPEDKR